MIVAPSSPGTGIIHREWIDQFGTVRDLTWETSPSLFISGGATGLGTAGAEVADEKLPTAPGSVVRHLSTPPSRIEIPITIIGTSPGDLINSMDTLRGWFDTGDERSRTPGYLRVTRPDGSIRQLMCYYAGGLEGDPKRGGPNSVTYVVSLFAPDPWATASAATSVTWTAGSLPFVSQINEGQMAAYPIWTITATSGATTSMSVANLTTGKAFSLVFSLGTGKHVTIDTRPASARTDLPILDSDGVPHQPLAGGQIFGNWLDPGTNSFQITLVTSGSAQIQLSYLPRYRGALW